MKKKKRELFNLCYASDREIDRLLHNTPVKCDAYMFMCLARYWKDSFNKIVENGWVNEYYRYVRKKRRQEQKNKKNKR